MGIYSGQSLLIRFVQNEKMSCFVQLDACKEFFGTQLARSRIAVLYAEGMFAAWIEEEMDLRSGQASGQAGCDTTLGDATAVHALSDWNGRGEMVWDVILANFASRTC